MRITIVLCLLLGYSLVSMSQTVTITDQQTKKPMEVVVLLSQNPQLSIITNAKGQAGISVFKKADEIQIRTLGYKTVITNYSELQTANFIVEMEPTIMNFDQVVVSASRWRQTAVNVPSKITSISAKEVALENPQTAADLLGISGKVFIQKSQQGGGSPLIRGFATNRLIYSVDGVRMNNAIFRGGNLQNVISLDPFATENTEVLFGPGSVIYGSDAIGGVMSFQTLTPQLSFSDKPLVTGKAVTRYSSANNERTGHFDVNIGWKKWALVTSFSAWDYDHLRQGSNGPDDYIKPVYVQRQDSTDRVITQDDPLLQVPSAYSQYNLLQKVRFSPNENWDLQYAFHYSETTPYGRYDRHNRYRNGTLRYAEWNYGPQKWMMNNFSVTNHKSNALYDEMNLIVAWQSFEESRIDRSLNKDERTTNTENVEAYSVNLDLVKHMGKKHHLFYGVEYVLNDVTSKGVVKDISKGAEVVGPARYPLSTWKSIGIYVSDEFIVSDKFTLQSGLHYNLYALNADFSNNVDFYPFPFTEAKISNGALTGSFGGVFHPSETWVIKANFGTAFRSPNVDDIGKVFDSEPGTVTVPNPDLEAEYAYNVDLGVAKVFSNWLKVDVTGYYTILKNAMVRRDFQLDGVDSILYDGVQSRVQAIQNAAVANVYGVQTEVEIKLPVGFSVVSDLNYQIGEEELDDGSKSPSRHAAPLFGVSRLRYSNGDLTLEFSAIYQGEKSFEDLSVDEQGKDEIYAKDENGNNYSPAWHTINIKAIYQLNDTFGISCGLENISDNRYRSYSSGISGPGRNFICSLRASF